MGMQLNLNMNMMQTVLRQMPLLIMALTVILQLTAVSQRRDRLVLKKAVLPDRGAMQRGKNEY